MIIPKLPRLRLGRAPVDDMGQPGSLGSLVQGWSYPVLRDGGPEVLQLGLQEGGLLGADLETSLAESRQHYPERGDVTCGVFAKAQKVITYERHPSTSWRISQTVRQKELGDPVKPIAARVKK